MGVTFKNVGTLEINVGFIPNNIKNALTREGYIIVEDDVTDNDIYTSWKKYYIIDRVTTNSDNDVHVTGEDKEE